MAPFILRIVSKLSDMGHAVLPANYTMPALSSSEETVRAIVSEGSPGRRSELWSYGGRICETSRL